MGEKKKAGAMLVRLVSAAGTGFFYVVKKTKRLHTENIKLEFRKYDPRVNRHVLFTEAKMNTHRLKRELSSLHCGQKQHALEAYGFVYALQCWAYEVLPALGTFCASLIPDNLRAFPRILRWSVTKDLKSFEEGLCKFFLAEHGSDPVGVVLSTPDITKLVDLGITSSMSVASPTPVVDLTKRVGRRLDFDVVEKHDAKSKKRPYKRKIEAVRDSPQVTKSPKDKDIVYSSFVGSARSKKTATTRKCSKSSRTASTSKTNAVTPESGNLSGDSNLNAVMAMLVRLNCEVKCLEDMVLSKFNMFQGMLENLSCHKCCRCSVVFDTVKGRNKDCEFIGEVCPKGKYEVLNEVNVETSTFCGRYSVFEGPRGPKNTPYDPKVFDPNEIDNGSSELDEYNLWIDECSKSNGHKLVSLPTEVLKYADVEWFNVLWRPTGWLESTHIDALTNLLIMRYDKDFGSTKPRRWTCMEICCWQLLSEATAADFAPVVMPYVRGEKPISGGVNWVDATHVYGVANINNCHWVLYVVSLHEQLITVYNSVEQSWDCILAHFKKFRNNIATACAIGGIWERSSFERPQLKTTWDIIEFLNPPRQVNLNDCGIMVIKYMECVAYNIPVFFINPKICENSRQRYCAKLFKHSQLVKQEQM